jgi:hypothetical protein
LLNKCLSAQVRSGIFAHVLYQFFGEVCGGDAIGPSGDGGTEGGDLVESEIAVVRGTDGVGPKIGVDGDGGLNGRLGRKG